jgi:hypothetical protein
MAELAKYGTQTTFYFPLVTKDAADFLTGATHASGDTKLIKDGGASANTTNGFTDEGNGFYSLVLTATEMQASRLCLSIIDQGTKAWEDQAVIIQTHGNASASLVFDLDQATPAVNATQISGDSTAADNCEAMFDGTGYAGGTIRLAVNAAQLGGTNQTGRDIGASVLLSSGTGTGQVTLTSGRVNADITHIGAAAVSTSTAQLGVNVVNAAGTAWNSGAIGANTLATDTITAAKIAADAIGASELAADAAAEIGTAVWATTTRLLTAGTNIVLAKGTGVTGFNDLSAAQVNAEADTALADVGLTTTITGRIDAAVSTRLASASYTAPDNTSITTILADTNELQTDWVNGGRLDLIVDAINAKTTNLPSDPADASVIAGRFDTLDTSVADLPTNAELTTALGTADDAVLTAISTVSGKVDTVDTVVDAIKLKTDPLTYTVANVLDANIQYVNDVAVTGDGQTGTEWGPA